MPKKKQPAAKKKQQPAQLPRPFESRWADAVDLRRILNISRTTQFNWENDKLLMASELGGKKYYDLHALNKRLEAALKKRGKKP